MRALDECLFVYVTPQLAQQTRANLSLCFQPGVAACLPRRAGVPGACIVRRCCVRLEFGVGSRGAVYVSVTKNRASNSYWYITAPSMTVSWPVVCSQFGSHSCDHQMGSFLRQEQYLTEN